MDLEELSAISDWINLGVAGFVIAAFILSWVVSRRTHDDVKKERDDYKEAARTSLLGMMESTASVKQLTGAVEKLTEAVQESLAMQREFQRQILDLLHRFLPGGTGVPK